MVLDYSKWDTLELSDDSDIEVHPNVDKKSFIRAKQAQIHQERDSRRHQITTLEYEKLINEGLLTRIDRLLTALKSHRASSSNADQLVFQSLMESAGDPSEDMPPTPPAGVHEHVKEKPTYSKMMAALVDQVKQEVDKSSNENRLEAFIEETDKHKAKVNELQGELFKKLAELQKEAGRHITSDGLKEGFNYSHVAKKDEEAKFKSDTTSSQATKSDLPQGTASGSTFKDSPSAPSSTQGRTALQRADTGQSSGAEADVEDGGVDDGDETEASPLAKQFAKIASTDYRELHQFIQSNSSILHEKNTDGLLMEAFNSELDNKPKHARTCVHQALLIQYCRSLGRDGVALFFKRISDKEHKANHMFLNDVRDTYARIHTRAAEIKKEREENAGQEGVEQIQLHAVDPGTQINIAVPPADSEDEEVKASRALFDAFPPGLQRALETGSLDEVNKVLGKMSVEEAEEVVAQLGEGGMLSMEEGVIDATTEEGRRAMEEIEKNHKMPGAEEKGKELAPDPE